MVARDKPRLIVFDVEGVLIPKNRFLFEAGKKLGFIKLINLLFYGFLYEAGVIKLESALIRAFRELRGVKPEDLMLIFNKISSTAFLQTLCAQIKMRNCKIALISSGVPSDIVKNLAITVGADYAYGIEVETKDGRLTGKIGGDVIQPSGKLKILSQIITLELSLIHI